MEIGRQRASIGIALAIGQFRFKDAGGAGADEYADTVMAVAFDSCPHRFGKTVLLQSQLSQTVVAAIELLHLSG